MTSCFEFIKSKVTDSDLETGTEEQLAEEFPAMRMWLDTIRGNVLAEMKVTEDILVLRRLHYLRKSADSSIALVSKLILSSDRSFAVHTSLHNIYKSVTRYACIWKLSKLLPPPVFLRGELHPSLNTRFGRLVTIIRTRIGSYRIKLSVRRKKFDKSANLLKIAKGKGAVTKPSRHGNYSHRDLVARMSGRYGCRIKIKRMVQKSTLRTLQESEHTETETQPPTTDSITAPPISSFENADSGKLFSKTESSVKRITNQDAKYEEPAISASPDVTKENECTKSLMLEESPRQIAHATLPPLKKSPKASRKSKQKLRHDTDTECMSSLPALPPLGLGHAALPPVELGHAALPPVGLGHAALPPVGFGHAALSLGGFGHAALPPIKRSGSPILPPRPDTPNSSPDIFVDTSLGSPDIFEDTCPREREYDNMNNDPRKDNDTDIDLKLKSSTSNSTSASSNPDSRSVTRKIPIIIRAWRRLKSIFCVSNRVAPQ